jgi:hypothetical protein
MSILVIVTFDLHRAKPNEYPRVKNALARLRLKKKLLSKKSGKLNKLPANTFAAKFSRVEQETSQAASQLCAKSSAEHHKEVWVKCHDICRCW